MTSAEDDEDWGAGEALPLFLAALDGAPGFAAGVWVGGELEEVVPVVMTASAACPGAGVEVGPAAGPAAGPMAAAAGAADAADAAEPSAVVAGFLFFFAIGSRRHGYLTARSARGQERRVTAGLAGLTAETGGAGRE